MVADYTPEENGDEMALATILYEELVDETGQIRPEAISPERIDRIRHRIQAGEIEPFMETNIRRGYYLYARERIIQTLERGRQRANGHRVRAFIPIAETVITGGPATWVRADENPEVACRHASRRINSLVRCAVLLHGPTLVRNGKLSWDGVGDLVTDIARAAVTDAKEAEDEDIPA